MKTIDAAPSDWAGIWPILRHIAEEGTTFCWPRDITEEHARAIWMAPPPNRTLILRDDTGAILGTATLHPNRDGAAAHVANASFAVGPLARGRGAGRQLALDTLGRARAEGYRAMQFNAVGGCPGSRGT